MRDAINNNPMVQIGVLAGLLLIVAVLMMTRMGGEEAPPPPSDAAAAAAVGVPTGVSSDGSPVGGGLPSTDTGSVGGPAGGAPPPVTSAPSTSAPPSTVSPEALKPGPGLPAPVADAITSGDPVVLLIVKRSAVDDRLVQDSVSTLSSRPGIAVFVVPVDEIAKYSRVTQGAGVNRVPALVVVRPGKANGKESPEATVAYGFRKAPSIVQAVDDALYTGKDNLPYHPG